MSLDMTTNDDVPEYDANKLLMSICSKQDPNTTEDITDAVP